mgnify:CR=1 FL=1
MPKEYDSCYNENMLFILFILNFPLLFIIIMRLGNLYKTMEIFGDPSIVVMFIHIIYIYIMMLFVQKYVYIHEVGHHKT